MNLVRAGQLRNKIVDNQIFVYISVENVVKVTNKSEVTKLSALNQLTPVGILLVLVLGRRNLLLPSVSLFKNSIVELIYNIALGVSNVDKVNHRPVLATHSVLVHLISR